MMTKHKAFGVLLSAILLICFTAGDISAKDTDENGTRGVEQIASLGSMTPQSHPSSIMPEFNEHLKDDSLSARIHHDRGVDYTDKGQYDLALPEFDKVLELYPLSAETYNNRGITYAKKGDLDHAIADFTRALAINPDDAKAYYNRGIAYAIRRQVDLALSDLEKCVKLEPTNAAAYKSMGVILASLACSYWERACQLGNCDRLEKAAQIGLCVAAPGNNSLSP